MKKNNNPYKITIYDNPLIKKNIIFEGDTRKFYKITYSNDKEDLIKIISQDLYINIVSILNGSYKLDIKTFIDIIKRNNIKEFNC